MNHMENYSEIKPLAYHKFGSPAASTIYTASIAAAAVGAVGGLAAMVIGVNPEAGLIGQKVAISSMLYLSGVGIRETAKEFKEDNRKKEIPVIRQIPLDFKL